MARSILVCIFLAELLCISLSQALTGDSDKAELQSVSFPINRKFGGLIVIRSVEEGLMAAEGPIHSDAEGPVGVLEGRLSKKHNRGVDPSIAGGGVIIGGLATTFLFAIFAYVRATKRTAKIIADSSSSVH